MSINCKTPQVRFEEKNSLKTIHFELKGEFMENVEF